MSQHITVTGVPHDPTQGLAPPSRLEINTFVKNEKMFSLYVQALQRMYEMSQDEDASYFGIGGIHGLPYKQWQGSGDDGPASGSDWGGYCTHGTTLFPTWHRPYVALYEQLLQAHAAAVAETYTSDDAAAWKQTAASFRLPYWDWAANAVPPSQVASDTHITILQAPGATSISIDNPLLHYVFRPIHSSFPKPYSVWPKTLRHPTSETADAESNSKEMISDLKAEQRAIRLDTFNLLTLVHAWQDFSNHSNSQGGNKVAVNSVEAIHDNIHDNVGAAGHMGDSAVAGLDPIFWIHHCQVDRLLALWQALNPDEKVSDGPAVRGTYTTSASATMTATSALTPFWNGPETYWTSVQIRDFQKGFGYTYPEFTGLDMSKPADVQAAIAAKVNELYGESSRRAFAFAAAGAAVPADGATISSVTSAAETLLQRTHATQAAPLQAQQLFTAAISATPAALSDQASAPESTGLSTRSLELFAQPSKDLVDIQVAPGGDHKYYDWTVKIHSKKNELKGTYSVLIFLGAVPEDPANWRSSPSYVGGHHVFVNSVSERCANCSNHDDLTVEGFVHLNDVIAAKSGLFSFEPVGVEQYLTKDLHWRVQRADRTAVDTATLTSLVVSVVATPLAFYPTDPFPVSNGPPVPYHTITNERVGGHWL